MAKKQPKKSRAAEQKVTLALPDAITHSNDHHEPAGIICIVDVEQFSTLDTRKQQIDLVRKLWHASQKTDLLRNAEPPAHINGTGDGLLIAVRHTPDRMRQSLLWARDLISDSQISQFGRRLRFGLHCGAYTVLGGEPAMFAVGTALNQCTRVASIGDGGHVIVSEAFVAEYAQHVGWAGIDGVFEPSDKDKHYIASTKHGARIPFRIYRVANVDPPVPKRLRTIQVANDNIAATLPLIEASFRDAIRVAAKTNKVNIGKSRLDIRVCIFEPDHNTKLLISDEFRHNKSNHGIRPTGAEYSISGGGTGVCGRAFCTKNPVVLHKLPKRTTNQRGYDDPHVALGVSQPSIDRWQRHSQSMVAFPFAVMNGKAIDNALGVVCVDVLNDGLDWMSTSYLEGIGVDLMLHYGILLGALFSLRF